MQQRKINAWNVVLDSMSLQMVKNALNTQLELKTVEFILPNSIANNALKTTLFRETTALRSFKKKESINASSMWINSTVKNVLMDLLLKTKSAKQF